MQNAEQAAAYLNAALEDDDPNVFLLALKDVAIAQGGMSKLASETSLNRENLYRMFSDKGNPRLSSLRTLLTSFGLGISVYPQNDDKRQSA